MSESICFHSFRGTPSEMGRQHGEALAHSIREIADERISILRDRSPAMTDTIIREACEEPLAEIYRILPEVADEIRGIAEAADVAPWQLLVAGGYSDIDHLIADAKAGDNCSPIAECTLVPAIDDTGTLLLAGTWDSHASAQNALVLVERHPSGGSATLALTTAGWPMQQGVTSAGLGFAIANLVPSTPNVGVPYVAALPRVAAKKSLESAVAMVRTIPLCSGRFFALCDASGAYAGIESDGRQFWVSRELTAHTNHFVFDDAVAYEGRPEIRTASELRRQCAATRVACLDTIDRASLFGALAYNDGTAATVSRDGNGREERTCAAFVIEPARLSLSYTVGPPHLADYETRSLACQEL